MYFFNELLKKKIHRNCQEKPQQVNAKGIFKDIVEGYKKNAEGLAGSTISKGISKKSLKNCRNKSQTSSRRIFQTNRQGDFSTEMPKGFLK